jgi:glucose-6-phosphate 1-dehydrogenase
LQESLAALNEFIGKQEAAAGFKSGQSNRVMYLALPQTTFVPITECIRSSCWSSNGWNRIVVEKPVTPVPNEP